MAWDVYPQPLKGPRTPKELLKFRFPALVSLKVLGICMFNRYPWRVWWEWTVSHMWRDGGPLKQNAMVGMVSRLRRRFYSETSSSLHATSPPKHPHVHISHQRRLSPVLVCSPWERHCIFSLSLFFFFFGKSVAAKMSKLPECGTVITACPTFFHYRK